MQSQISKEMAETLYKQHSDYVFRIALFLTRSKEMADDIMQETFLKVYSKYASFDSTKSIQPWIYKITLNTTRNMLRKQKWISFTDKMTDSASAELLETSLITNEEANVLWREVCKLSLKRKEIIVLHFYLGMKLREIAIALNIPEGTCKSRLNAALCALKKRLEKREFEILDLGGVYYEAN